MRKKGPGVLAIVGTLTLLSFPSAAQDQEQRGIDAEGYVCSWLVLAPIPIEAGQDGATALDRAQIQGEDNLKPKAGETVRVGGKDLTWREHRTKEQILDFNDLLGKTTENSVGYAVAYLVADADQRELTLLLGSDDQVKVYLNGKLIHTHDEGRPLEKDEDRIPGLTLRKGRNVLILKIVNEEEDWAGSARFVDEHGKPIAGVKATTKPE
jgi:hypothetical protein